MFVCFTLFCAHMLLDVSYASLGESGLVFLLQTVCPFGSSHSVGFTASLALGQTLLSCSREEGLVGSPPGLDPTGQCSVAGSHHGTIQPASWKRINVPPRWSPCFARPRSRSVCFHQTEMCLPLASRGLIRSNAGGGCPWTASRSCPLLAGSRIGGCTWETRSCGFRLRLRGQEVCVSQRDPETERQLWQKTLCLVLACGAALISPS